MTYADFRSRQERYLERVTPRGGTDAIDLIPEKDYGGDFTVKLLDSDGIQESLDVARAKAEAQGRPFDEGREKGLLIGEVAGDLTREAKLEYDKFVPAENPDKLLAGLSGFYAEMTGGGDLAADCRTEAGRRDIARLLGKDDLSGVSEVEAAAALTAVTKTRALPAFLDLNNTNTMAAYHLIVVENKSANPYGFYKSRLENMPEETKKRLLPLADKLMPVTHDGGAWHEMTHALGTDDESKCEGFRFLKTLKEYQEPALILPDVNARLYNNLSTLETIRKDARKGETTLNGNFRYIMPAMLIYTVENAADLAAEASKMSDAELMEKNKEIVARTAYPKETETAFRSLAETCDSPEALALKMQEAYKNGANHPETGAVYALANDFVRAAHLLNPSIPADRLVETVFAPENFSSQSRNAGKEKIEAKTDFVLSPAEKKRCQALYAEIRQNDPSLSATEVNKAFAVAVVKDAWREKREVEAELEDPKKARHILFDAQECLSRTKQINACLMRSRNAALIARTYAAEFERGMTKRGLHDTLKTIDGRLSEEKAGTRNSAKTRESVPATVSAKVFGQRSGRGV